MLDILKKADKGIMWLQTAFCVIMMFALMWLVFAMVFWRYVLNNSIVWAEEVLRYMMMSASMCCRPFLRSGPRCGRSTT